MEAILNSLAAERRRYHVDLRQIAEAVILALCCAFLCRYVCVKTDDIPAKKAAPVTESISGGLAEYGLPMVPELIGRNRSELFPEPAETGRSGESPEIRDMFSDAGIPVVLADASEEGSGGTKTAGRRDAKKTAVTETAGSAALQDQALPEQIPGVTDPSAAAKPEAEEKAAPLLSVELYGNGGTPELVTDTCEEGAFELSGYGEPKRLGKLFDGWYTDAEGTRAFSGVADGETSLRLYAGWREFPGFVSNDRGYITGYTDPSEFIGDGMAVFPYYDTCTGIEKNALNGLEGEIFELYIPANITYIEEGAFDRLEHLLYVQVEEGNPAFYSRHGTLYRADGSEFISREH